MKRFTGLMAVVFLLGSVGPTVAAFETGRLLQVVYKNDDSEVGTDLLDLLTFNLGQQNVEISPAGTVNLGQFVTTNDWSDLALGFFSYTGPADNHVYFVTRQPTAPDVRSNSWSAFLGAFDGIIQYYGTLGSGSTVVGDPEQPGSYWTKMDSGTTPGQYAGLNVDFSDGEAALGALNSSGGYVDMYLYKFERVSRDVLLVPGTGADYTAVLRLRNNGSTVLNPPVTAVAPVINAIPDGSTTAGVPYTGPIPSLSQGTPPITWTLAAGPAGMTINGSTGAVSWTNPTTAGSPHTVTIQAANGAGSDQESWQLTVTSTAVAPVIDPIADEVIVAGVPYTGPIPSLSQGTLPITWTLAAGPAGMTINGSTGLVSWTNPTTAGSPHTVTIQAANGTGSDQESWQLTVSATAIAPVIDPIAGDSATAGVPYTGPQPSLSQGTASITWTLAAGPAGMTINGSTGVVSWTNPTTAGSPHTVTIQAANGTGSDQESFQLTVTVNLVAPVIAPIDDDVAAAGSPYTGSAPALLAGTLPVTWSLAAGPPGMTIDDGTGVVSWSAPTVAGSPYTVTIQAENTAGSDQQGWRLTVTEAGVPTAPSLNAPQDGGEVDTLNPTLSVNNASAVGNPDLTYTFEVYEDPGLASKDLVTSETGVPEGQNVTEWEADTQLGEDMQYFWRSRACDGATCSSWMATANFFVNTANEPPFVPTPESPIDGDEVGTLQPALVVENAIDADGDPLRYDFEVYNDESMTSLLRSQDGVPEGGGTTTRWTVSPALGQDNTTYWWRARARDDEEVASEWSDLVSFFVNTTGVHPPEPPSLNSPPDGSTVRTLFPTLVVDNAFDQDEGDTLTYFFETDKSNGFGSDFLEQSGERPEGLGGTTSWSPSQLDDNTIYYWRARARDQVGAASPWMGRTEEDPDPPSFCVSLFNEPPAAVDDEGATDKTTPVTIDVLDNDLAVDCDAVLVPGSVEIVQEPGHASAVVNEDGTVRYRPDETFNGTDSFTYTVEDSHGLVSGEAEVRVTDQLPAPTVNNPVSGGTVTSRSPTLSVNNSAFAGAAELKYEFELYSSPNLADFVASSVVPEGKQITSWFLATTLEDNGTYYWRARVTDNIVVSSWMSTAVFVVNTAGADTEVDIQVSQQVSASASETVTVTVTDVDSPIHGAAVRIPPGALSEDATITIGVVTNPPALPDDTKALGFVIDFGPEGIEFNTPVTILIPYTEDDLTEAGVDDPSKLKVFTYDVSELAWEKLIVEGVDIENQRLIVRKDSFSMFTTGKTIKKFTPPPAEEGGGDGGPCSIAAAGQGPSAHLRDGRQLILDLGWMALLLLGAAGVIRKGNRGERDHS